MTFPRTGKARGYERVDGNRMRRLATDEIVPSVTVQVPVDSRIYTPEDQEEHRKRKELEQEEENARRLNRRLGDFYFADSSHKYEDIKPFNMTRLIFLATYIPYGDQYLFLNGHKMNGKELQKVLRLSDATFSRFWRDVVGKYLFRDSSGHFFMAGDFSKGKLKEDHHARTKIYSKAIRELYNSCQISQQKLLGHVFQLLPYINVEFNIVSENPYEKDLSAVQPMTLNQFCRIIGQTETKRARVIKDFEKIKFKVGNHLESFCSFVISDCKLENAKIFVNPHVLYSGSNWEKVEILGAFQDKNESA